MTDHPDDDQGGTVHPILVARELVVVDDEGRPRARLGKLRINRPLPPSLDAGYGFELVDPDGTPRIAILCPPQGPLLAVDYGGTTVLTLGIHDPALANAFAQAGIDQPANPGPFLAMTDLDGRPAYSVEIGHDGTVHQRGTIHAD
jgi:hypothetical protein